MTDHIPEEQIHHLKEAMAEDSFRNKIPMLALFIFILLAIFGATLYSYYHRDLPKCSDENVQIMLNQSIRGNDQLINGATTIAFNQITELAGDKTVRSCQTKLVTSKLSYLVRYQVVNQTKNPTFFNTLFGKVDYSVEILGVDLFTK